MARQPRKLQKSSLFSIKQKSDIKIFRNKEDRHAFVEILEQAKDKFGFDMYCYCLLDDDAFWLILNSNNRSVASIMQSISISYALYRSDVENLFSRRYKSEAIYNLNELSAIKKEMMQDQRYESCEFCFYNPKTKEPLEFISDIHQNIEIQTTYVQKTDTQSMIQFIEDYVKNHYASSELLKELEIRNQIIKHVYSCLNVTQSQLSDYFGISNSAISKILST